MIVNNIYKQNHVWSRRNTLHHYDDITLKKWLEKMVELLAILLYSIKFVNCGILNLQILSQFKVHDSSSLLSLIFEGNFLSKE